MGRARKPRSAIALADAPGELTDKFDLKCTIGGGPKRKSLVDPESGRIVDVSVGPSRANSSHSNPFRIDARLS
jgi:hypothetical protein